MKTKVSSSIEYFYEMSTQAFEQYCQGKCSKQQYEYYILVLKAKCQWNHKEEMVDFLKWIEGVYSFGNVQGLWYEHINTQREYTTEQLYNKYYNETFGGNNE